MPDYYIQRVLSPINKEGTLYVRVCVRVEHLEFLTVRSENLLGGLFLTRSIIVNFFRTSYYHQ